MLPSETVRFSALEWEIIEHRLCMSDCLHDALVDDGQYTVAQIDAACAAINPQDTDLSNPVVRAVLVDCCDSSTFFSGLQDAVATGEVSPRRAAALRRARAGLMRKLGVSIPLV